MVRPYLNDVANDQVERAAVYRFYGALVALILQLSMVCSVSARGPLHPPGCSRWL